MLLLIWFLTVVISYFIGRYVLKLIIEEEGSITHNDSNAGTIFFWAILVLIIPLLNVLVYTISLIIVLRETSKIDWEEWFKKFFDIK